jgi:hypothetical protein
LFNCSFAKATALFIVVDPPPTDAGAGTPLIASSTAGSSSIIMRWKITAGSVSRIILKAKCRKNNSDFRDMISYAEVSGPK